jgi:hypothetical protein
MQVIRTAGPFFFSQLQLLRVYEGLYVSYLKKKKKSFFVPQHGCSKDDQQKRREQKQEENETKRNHISM